MATRISDLKRRGSVQREATRVKDRPAGGTDPCPPPCPACGGLECLCRPRFFAGQLLTEQDLNRLDAYIRGKHRLHNRHLHGWGVVCGLEVTCHDCENLVVVGSGYALSPCGDDIVVCRDEPVDVCKLIRACDRERRRPACDPPRRTDPACRDAEETWVLAICYAEHASREVAALRSTGCACGGRGCGCKGGGSGGCGCGGSSGHTGKGNGCGCGNGNGNGQRHTAAGTTTRTSRIPPQCEPTVVCESADYRVWRAPTPAELRDDDATGGPLAERAMHCIQPYLDWAEAVGKGPSPGAPQAQRSRFCCNMKERLRELLLERPVHDCELLQRLDRIVCPAPGDEDFDQAMDRAGVEVVYIWFQALMSCICSVLLPPCPGPEHDNCVPLATVTVRRSQGGCRILRVCNWTVHRKFATTFPALQYWLSVLPFGRYLRRVMEDACCGLFARLRPNQKSVSGEREGQPGSTGFFAADVREGFDPGERFDMDAGAGFNDPMPFFSGRSREVSTLLARIALGTATPLDPLALMSGLGRQKREAEEEPGAKQPRLTSLEREYLPQYLLGSQLLPAALAGAIPHDLDAVLPGMMGLAARAGLGGLGRATGEAAAGADVEALRREIEELRSAVEAQRRTIETLEQRLDNA